MSESNLTVFSPFADCDEVLRHPCVVSGRTKSTIAQRHMAELDSAPRWLNAYLRDLIERRRSQPGEDLMSGLIQGEEYMRYDPPVQLASRIAGESMTISGATVPEGDTMMLLLATAHPDPAANERPDEFDPKREASGTSDSAKARTSVSGRR